MDATDLVRRQTTAGWTNKRLGQEIRRAAKRLGRSEPGVDDATISRWRSGKRPISTAYADLIDEAFRHNVDVNANQEQDEMHRRDFLRAATGAATLLALPGVDLADQLARVIAPPARIDPATVRALEATTTTLSRSFITTPGVGLWPAVAGHLAGLRAHLADTGTGDLRPVLLSSAAETSILASWLARDAGDDAAAERYAVVALSAAEEGHDPAIGAYGLASISMLRGWRTTSADTVELLTSGEVRGQRARNASPTTRAWVQVLIAEAAARGGDTGRAIRSLDRAGTLLDQAGDEGPEARPRAPFFDLDRLVAERGVIAQRAGGHGEAVALLAEAIDRHAGLKIQGRYRLARGESFVALGDVDAAVADGLAALDVAEAFGFDEDRKAVAGLRDRMPVGAGRDRLDEALAA